MMLLIWFCGVIKIYGFGVVVFEVLCGIDIDVEVGEFVVIMGLSGFGKLMMMNLFGCFDILGDGEYLFSGRVL